MANFFYAECVPCRWQEAHTEQDAAIEAAELHIADHHSRMKPRERAAARVGHVQNRDERAVDGFLPRPGTQPDASQPAESTAVEAIQEIEV